MEAISRSCLPEAAARTKRQRKATCCGVLGAPSHRTTCSRSSAAKLTSGLLLAMRTHISYWPQYVYLFMIHTSSDGIERTNLKDDACRKGVALWIPQDVRKDPDVSKLEDALYRRGSPGTMGKKIDGTFEGRFEWRPKERTASRPVETGRAGSGRPGGGELRWPV